MTNLPKGTQMSFDGIYGYDSAWADYHNQQLEEKIEVKKLQCECGTSITMGKDDHPLYHQIYCPIGKNYEESK